MARERYFRAPDGQRPPPPKSPPKRFRPRRRSGFRPPPKGPPPPLKDGAFGEPPKRRQQFGKRVAKAAMRRVLFKIAPRLALRMSPVGRILDAYDLYQWWFNPQSRSGDKNCRLLMRGYTDHQAYGPKCVPCGHGSQMRYVTTVFSSPDPIIGTCGLAPTGTLLGADNGSGGYTDYCEVAHETANLWNTTPNGAGSVAAFRCRTSITGRFQYYEFWSWDTTTTGVRNNPPIPFRFAQPLPRAAPPPPSVREKGYAKPLPDLIDPPQVLPQLKGAPPFHWSNEPVHQNRPGQEKWKIPHSKAADLYGKLTEIKDAAKCVNKNVSKKYRAANGRPGKGLHNEVMYALDAIMSGEVDFIGTNNCLHQANGNDFIIGKFNKIANDAVVNAPGYRRPVGIGAGGAFRRSWSVIG